MTGRALSVRFVDMSDSPRIQRLRADVTAGRRGAVEEFWREVTAAGTPLVEPSDDGHALVTFLLRAEARQVRGYRAGGCSRPSARPRRWVVAAASGCTAQPTFPPPGCPYWWSSTASRRCRGSSP